MCEQCFPPDYVPSEGDLDDHVILRRHEIVRFHLISGAVGNALVQHVDPAGVRFSVLSLSAGEKDVELPTHLPEHVWVVPWPHIVSLAVDPTDPWPNEKKFWRKMRKRYPQHFTGSAETP
jgi:hypothetical protein